MIFPKTKEVYEYDNKKYIVVSFSLFHDVYVQDFLEGDAKECSSFYTFNWWKFIFNAKHIGTVKLNKAY